MLVTDNLSMQVPEANGNGPKIASCCFSTLYTANLHVYKRVRTAQVLQSSLDTHSYCGQVFVGRLQLWLREIHVINLLQGHQVHMRMRYFQADN